MIIGIMGKARAGKDTLATYLGEEFNKQKNSTYIMIAYALELKKRVQRDFDLSYDQLWGDLKEVPDRRYPKPIKPFSHHPPPHMDQTLPNSHYSPREFLQNYGQFFRTMDPNYWVKALFDTIEEKGYKNVIITDCRHPNEVTPIIERGGIVIRITRPVEGAAQQPDHISETALDNADLDIDFEVRNDGSLEDLRHQAMQLVDIMTQLHKMKSKEIKQDG
jgi:hypothetical protein